MLSLLADLLVFFTAFAVGFAITHYLVNKARRR